MKSSEVIVKISKCQKCNGIVRTAIKHMMDARSKREFADEVLDYNLLVIEKSLPEYSNEKNNWCQCND